MTKRELITESRIAGAFEGWDDKTYLLQNGEEWEPTEYKYHYRYDYMPQARVWKEGSSHHLEVDGMSDTMKVRRAN